jgi:hypothetical protein
MAFQFKNSRGTTYYLHARVTKTDSGKERRLYFFSKEAKEGAIDKVPDGYEVSESSTGLPVLKRKDGSK